MEMSPQRTPRATRSVSACPWCGPGTNLALSYDTVGSVHVACTVCHCVGPKVAITGDFADAEEAAIGAWSKRALGQVDHETLSRVKLSIGLHCLTGRLTSEAVIGVAWSDLNALLQAVNQPGRPEPG